MVEAEQRWAEDQKKAPIYGRYFGPSYTCALWPVRSAPQFKPTGSGAAPILVVGATGDPATPYQWGELVAGQLADARLLTYDGTGHTAYTQGSSCIDDAVDAYLLRGDLPAEGTVCQ